MTTSDRIDRTLDNSPARPSPTVNGKGHLVLHGIQRTGFFPWLLVAAWPSAWLLAFLILPSLPDFPAVVVAAILALLIPGLVLLRLTSAKVTLPEAFCLSFLLGVGQLTVFSVPALLLHIPLAFVVVAHVALTLALLPFSLAGRRLSIAVDRLDAALITLLVATAVVVGVGTQGELARSSDNWIVLPYTASYAAGGGLNEEDPTVGAGVEVTSRRSFNIVSVAQATLGETADADLVDIAVDHIHTVGVFFGLLSVFILSARLGSSQRAGFFGLLFGAVLAVSDIYTQEGYGRSLLLRGGEDKFLASFALFPAFVVLALYCSGDLAGRVLSVLAALAVVFMHPFGAAFVALTVAALVGAAWLSGDALGEKLRLGSVLGIAAVVPAVIQRFVLPSDHADRFAGENQIRLDVRQLDLPFDLVSMHWNMLTHPLMWVAILATPLAIFLVKDNRARVFIALAGLLLPAALFFPPTATVLARLGSPGLLWRFLLVVPFASVLAVICTRFTSNPARQLVAVAAIILAGIGARELVAHANGDYYGDFGKSVVEAGLEAAWAPEGGIAALSSDRTRGMVEELDAVIDGEALLLVPMAVRDPETGSTVGLDSAIPGYAAELKSYTSGPYFNVTEPRGDPAAPGDAILEPGRTGARKRALFSLDLYFDRMPPMIPIDVLFRDKPITHILALTGGPTAGRLSQSDSFELVGQTSFGYSLYEVIRAEES